MKNFFFTSTILKKININYLKKMQSGKEFRWQFIKQSYADNKNINDESSEFSNNNVEEDEQSENESELSDISENTNNKNEINPNKMSKKRIYLKNQLAYHKKLDHIKTVKKIENKLIELSSTSYIKRNNNIKKNLEQKEKRLNEIKNIEITKDISKELKKMLDGFKRAEKTNVNETNEIKEIRTNLINEINNFREKNNLCYPKREIVGKKIIKKVKLDYAEKDIVYEIDMINKFI